MPDGNIFGKMGEHNANVLEITPPAEMSENKNIELYCVAFEVGRDFVKTVVRSEMIAKSNTVSVPLWHQTTVGENIKFQLEAYDGENNLLVKSQLVEGVFLPSVSGVRSAGDYEYNGMSASVAANTIARHTHENADVLENLADDKGTLIYNGNPIGVSTERPTATYETAIDGSSNMYVQENGYDFKIAMMINTGEEPEIALIGKEVAKIEFKTTTGEWILLEETSEKDLNPLVVTLKHIIRKDLDDIDSIVFTVIYYPAGTGWLKQSITNYQITDVKVTYYTD